LLFIWLILNYIITEVNLESVNYYNLVFMTSNKLLLVMFCLFTAAVISCDLFNADQLNDPNQISSEQADPDFLINNIQLEFKNVYRRAAQIGALNTRMKPMFGENYDHAYSPQSFNGIYNSSYSNVLIDAKYLITIAEERGLYFHTGMAKVMKAYTLILMVDLFGDLPYSEAFIGGANLNPSLDPGEEIYVSAIELLNEAINDLNNKNRVGMPENDLYYTGLTDEEKVDRWTRTANTILLKAHLNMGNSQEINNLVAENMLIDSPEHNFVFRYSSNAHNPDSRHPDFAGNYSGFAEQLMSVNYMNMLVNDKGDEMARDPRARYYFYRQYITDSPLPSNNCYHDSQNPPAHFQEGDPWCIVPNGEGYVGLDHLSRMSLHIPYEHRTTFGVYPAGGRYDASQGQKVNTEMGYRGAGFEPILMSSFTHFMLAEAAVSLGINGNGRQYLETAVRHSMETVSNFGAEQAENYFGEITDEKIDEYVSVVNDRWDDADYNNLRAISMEYYLALWPNGYEAYNMMRRTGYPNRSDNLQPAVSSNPGSWYYSLYYPAVMVERNSNVDQKSRTNRVFWNEGTNLFFDF